MKTILVALSTGRMHQNDYYMHIARETYLRKLNSRGFKVKFVSCIFPLEYASEEYDKCDGVLFMGGGDFDPKAYNENIDRHTAVPNPMQDNFELSILRWVIKDKKSFLGICRGCQALGIASGGKLIQHVPDYLVQQKIENENHGLSEGGIYSDLTDQVGHEVQILENSKTHKILGVLKLNINSGHHQSVGNVGENFIVSGRTEGGIVEVIESKDPKHFCFGIQGHPEALSESLWDKFFSFEI